MSGRDQSWPVPYLREFQNNIQPGQSLNIKGFIIGRKRFDINLTAGLRVAGNVRDDIALHISCRLEDGKFVLNSLINNEWGKEERHSLYFKEGQEFTVRVRAAKDDLFELYANGKEVGKYRYRLPLDSIKCIYVDGDCELYQVNWEGKFYELPFNKSPFSFVPGKQLYVSGAADTKARRFEINFVTGEDVYALHYNVRFDQKVVVRNSKLEKGGEWGTEEREESKFPFSRGHAFDVIFVCDEQGFRVFVDGKPHCVFAHRVPAADICQLSIEGDLELQGLHWS